jgi:hypothetical protein
LKEQRVISPEIIRSLLKKPVGDRTDIYLKFLLEPNFMGYWTFSRPKSQGIELADALVWFGDTMLLFEAKTRETGEADQGWIGSKLTEAIDQLNTRSDSLRKGGWRHYATAGGGKFDGHPRLSAPTMASLY